MQLEFGSLRKLCFGAVLGLSSMTAGAAYQVVNVAGTAGPWVWEDGGLNTDYQYGLGANGSTGIPDYTAPARLRLADIGLATGDAIYINYFGGLTSAFGGTPDTNNNGYVGSVFKDDELGSSNQRFPSFYYDSEWGKTQDPADPDPYGLFLQSLVGALTDDAGNIVQLLTLGTVYKTDTGQAFLFGVSFALPDNATYVQFGLNDDIFSDNSGALDVCVSSQNDQCTPAAVPVPGAGWLFATGIAGLLAYRRKCHV